MRTLVRILIGTIVSLALIEGMAFLALGAIALRGGHASTYFKTLWPHPAVACLPRTVDQMFFLGETPLAGYGGGGVPGRFKWYPVVEHYRWEDPDLGPLRDAPTFRPNELGVYLVGGSVAAQPELRKHLQAHLQAALKDRYEVHVFNEGVGGYMSTQQLALLETKILPFGNPHYVVAVDGYNDWLSTVFSSLGGLKDKAGVTEAIWPHAELSWFHYWFVEWRARQAVETIPGAFAQLAGVCSRQILKRTYTGWLVNHVLIWRAMRRNDKHPHDYVHHAMYLQTPTLSPARAELQGLNERMMAEVCHARGTRFFWVLQPLLPLRGDARTTEERRYYASRPPVYWDSVQRYYQDLRGLVRREARVWKSRFLDLSSLPSDASESLFIDTIHLTDAGADRAMQVVAEMIVKDVGSHPMEPLSPAVVQ